MEINRLLDISCVQAIHTIEEIDKLIETAVKYDVECVFTLPYFTEYVIGRLKGRSGVKTGGVVGFPSGGESTSMKVSQTKELARLGCGEIDMVMNLTLLNSGEYDLAAEDVSAVIRAAGDIPVKVIIEAPSITEDRIRTAVGICMDSGAAFVKTSTGWQEKKTEIKHIEMIRKYTEGRIKIKAAGGIRDISTIEAMYQLGCTRFGVNLDTAIKLLSS